MLIWPLASAAATIALPSSSEAPSGFSQNTGFPAAKAASAIARCVACGLAITTASTLGSATSSCQSFAARWNPKASLYRSAEASDPAATISSLGLRLVSNTAPTAA